MPPSIGFTCSMRNSGNGHGSGGQFFMKSNYSTNIDNLSCTRAMIYTQKTGGMFSNGRRLARVDIGDGVIHCKYL
jgi:hypothetical protein